jgi:hypothetical protein
MFGLPDRSNCTPTWARDIADATALIVQGACREQGRLQCMSQTWLVRQSRALRRDSPKAY